MEYPTGDSLSMCIPGLDCAVLTKTGGQKAVYRAAIAGQEVALKLIAVPPQVHSDVDDELDWNSTIERARREVGILEQVDIPVLVGQGPIGLDSCKVSDGLWIYFTEEWIEGKTLREMMREATLSPESVARLGVDLVQAVCCLYGLGVVHRDIKPENIMWSVDRSRFVLLDPGIALDLHGSSLTHFPMVVGTKPYFSPEQMDLINKRNLDFRSDLFSIGVVMYEAATGEHPFMTIATTESELFDSIRSRTPAPANTKIEGFPESLSSVISRFLGKRPHSRYRKCDFAKVAIQDAAASLGVLT